MTDWRKSSVAAVVGITLFLIVQLAIPISRIGDDARRFGWQMFSTAQQSPEFLVITDSEEIKIDLDDFMANNRADMDLETLLPPHLCKMVSGAMSVTWEDGDFQC